MAPTRLIAASGHLEPHMSHVQVSSWACTPDSLSEFRKRWWRTVTVNGRLSVMKD